jgi:hypothetical protein
MHFYFTSVNGPEPELGRRIRTLIEEYFFVIYDIAVEYRTPKGAQATLIPATKLPTPAPTITSCCQTYCRSDTQAFYSQYAFLSGPQREFQGRQLPHRLGEMFAKRLN